MQLTPNAQKVLDAVNRGEDVNSLAEQEGYECIQEWGSGSEDFGYALFDGGYIDPGLILVGDDLIRVNEAIKVLGEFKELYEKITEEL